MNKTRFLYLARLDALGDITPGERSELELLSRSLRKEVSISDEQAASDARIMELFRELDKLGDEARWRIQVDRENKESRNG